MHTCTGEWELMVEQSQLIVEATHVQGDAFVVCASIAGSMVVNITHALLCSFQPSWVPPTLMEQHAADMANPNISSFVSICNQVTLYTQLCDKE